MAITITITADCKSNTNKHVRAVIRYDETDKGLTLLEASRELNSDGYMILMSQKTLVDGGTQLLADAIQQWFETSV